MKNSSEVLNTHKYNSLLWERINKDVTDIYSLFSLMINRYFRSKTTILVYIFPIIIFFGAITILPAHLSIAFQYSTSLLFSGLVIYGVTFYNLKKSTIYENLRISHYNKMKIYLSILLLILFTNFLLYVYITAIYFILMITNNLTNSFPPPLDVTLHPRGLDFVTAEYTFVHAQWGIVTYYFFIATLSIFSTSLLIQAVSKNLKAYMIISVSYAMLALVFGGTVIINFPLVPSGTLDETANTYIVDPSSVVSINQSDELIKIYPERIGSGVNGEYLYQPAPTGIGETSFDLIWWLSQFLPIYFLNEMVFSAFQHTEINTTASAANQISVLYTIPSTGEVINLNGYTVEFAYFAFNNLEWASIIIFPYFLIVLYTLGGYFISRS